MKFFKSFTVFEYCLWTGAVAAILLSFFLCGNTDYYHLAGSLLGATGLILVSKGNVAGQVLCVLFAVYYGVVSYFRRYYGEMITYLCMTMPIAIAAVVSWLKNPFKGDHAEVKINKLRAREYAIILALAGGVTAAFYFILRALGTDNLLWSTVSVTTSFTAVALTFRRSPFYGLAYACNDVILIVLWGLAAAENREYLALVVCFSVFLIEDLYGFLHWIKMRRRQSEEARGEI